MSQSYTILPYINPPAGAYDAINAIGTQNNNFTVSQTFGAGIVDSGSLSVAGASTFTGVCTFASIPVFSAGINVAIAEVDTGTLNVAGSTSLNSGCAVSGAVLSCSAGLTVSSGASAVQALSATSIVDSGSLSAVGISSSSGLTVSSGITALQACSSTGFTASGASSFQNIVAVNGTFSGPIVGSAGLAVNAGATSLQATTVQGQLTVGSIVDSGVLTVTGLITGNAGLTIASGASSVQALSCTSLNCASAVDTGTLSCTALSCSNVIDAGAMSCTALTCSGITDTGSLSCTAITASVLGTFNGGLNITGSIVYNTSYVPIVPVVADVSVSLGNTTCCNFSVAPSANVNTITITGATAGSSFDILVSPSATMQWRKAMSAGTVTIYNNLAGNQSMASGSKWLIRGKCVSATVVYLEFINFT